MISVEGYQYLYISADAEQDTRPSTEDIEACRDFCREHGLLYSLRCTQIVAGDWSAVLKINQCRFSNLGTRFDTKKAAKKTLAHYAIFTLRSALENGTVDALVGEKSLDEIDYIALLQEYHQAHSLPSPEYRWSGTAASFTCSVALPQVDQEPVLMRSTESNTTRQVAKAAVARTAVEWLQQEGRMRENVCSMSKELAEDEI